jgi:C4-dicarboxylate-binding protein DctP
MRKGLGVVITVTVVALALWWSQGLLQPPAQAPLTQPDKNAPIKLRFGHNTPTDSALHQAALRFAQTVAEKTGQRVQVEVFPAQQLGNDHEMVEMAREGALDILLTPTAKMSIPLPAMQYADLPFFFPSREDAYALLDGEPGRLLLDKLDRIGLVGVTFWENGFKHFTGNQPFLRPEDFAGQKVRVMKSRIIMDQFRALGAEPVPIDFHATRQALADKVVAGQENPLVAIVSMGFHEVQSDLVLSEHAYLGYVFSISRKRFDDLPMEIANVLVETAQEITPWEREETQRREQALLETIRQAGVNVHRLTPEQRNAFAERVSRIAKASESVIGADILSKTEEILLEKYGPAADSGEQILIGIDADLSLDGGVAGLAIKRGVELALAEINESGGLLGKPLGLIARDHRVTTSMGMANLNHFIRRADVVAVIGGKHSAVIAEEIPLIQQARIPYLVPWATASVLTDNGHADNFLFRVSANDRLVSGFLVDYLLKHHKRPAILVENSIWGRGNLERMTAHLQGLGLKPGASLVVNRGQQDFSKELASISASGSDSLLLVLNSNEAAVLLGKLAEQAKPLPVVSHWGIIGGSFYRDVQRVLPRIDLRFFQTYSNRGKRQQQREALMARYRAAYAHPEDQSVEAPMAVAQAYDLTQLLALAIRQAGTTERRAVKQALEQLPPHSGVMKHYQPAFTPDNHDALGNDDFFMARFDVNGAIVPVPD